MRFSRGDWVHEDFMDVFIEVVKVQYADAKRIKLKIFWWNLGWTGSAMRIFPNSAPFEIKAKDFARWKRLESRIRTVPEVA